jgi:hypothetical protein
VLYGGGQSSPGQPVSFPTDTWTWDGQSWAQVAGGSSPNLFTSVGAFDLARGVLVVFGVAPGGEPQTWVWNGSQWTRKSSGTSPPARSDAMMGYDLIDRRVLLFGGFSHSSGMLGDTWLWDGSNWQQQQPASSPSARMLAAVASGRMLVLYGGSALQSDTWVWTGSTWTQAASAQNPGGRRDASATFDGTNVLLFGGESSGLLADMWQWDGLNWSRVEQG